MFCVHFPFPFFKKLKKKKKIKEKINRLKKNKGLRNITSETDKKRSLSVYCCTFSRGWPVKAAYILSIFCIIFTRARRKVESMLNIEQHTNAFRRI